MQVRALRHCDTSAGRALFEGQVYDLPEIEAGQLIEAGMVESLDPVKVRARDKAVQGPSS